MSRLGARLGARSYILPPTVTSAPTLVSDIDGVIQVGRTLSLVPGVYTGAAAVTGIRWFRNGLLISGAAQQNYLLVSADGTKTITAEETVHGPSGTLVTVTAGVGPVVTPGEAVPDPVLARTFGATVWGLRDPANSGYVGDTPATDIFNPAHWPSGVSIGSGKTATTITLGAAGGTLEGFDLSKVNLLVNGAWEIRNNLFGLSSGSTVYAITVAADDVYIHNNTIDGSYGLNSDGVISKLAAYIGHNSGKRLRAIANRFINTNPDLFKLSSGLTASSERPEVSGNYWTASGWHLHTTIAGQLPHADHITITNGGAWIHGNFWDSTEYSDPYWNTTPPIPLNTPSAAAPASYFTQDTDWIRISAQIPAAVIDNVLIEENIFLGKRRGNIDMFGIGGAGATYGVIQVINNLIEPSYSGQIFAVPTANVSVVFTGNTRLSDGAAFSESTTINNAPAPRTAAMNGDTGVGPDAPVIAGFDTIGTTTARIIFDRASDATSHQFAVSTTSDSAGFGAFTTLNVNTHVLTGLTSGVDNWVKMRGLKATGSITGPVSNVLKVTTN